MRRGQAELLLRMAYRSVLKELCKTDCRKVRIPPISGGGYSGAFEEDIAEMTMEAGSGALETLSEEEKKVLKGVLIEMCAYRGTETQAYKEALRKWKTQIGKAGRGAEALHGVGTNCSASS
jgi:hypothetical protein